MFSNRRPYLLQMFDFTIFTNIRKMKYTYKGTTESLLLQIIMKVFRIVNDNNYNVLLYCFKYIKQRGRVFSKFALCPQLCNVEYCSNVKARYSSNLTQKDQRGGEWALGWSDVSKTLPPIRYSFRSSRPKSHRVWPTRVAHSRQSFHFQKITEN